MRNRREFLAVSGISLVAVAGGWSRREFDSTWLVYAPNLEQFWAKLPFLDRLQKLSEAGFTRYEFGRWKTKDLTAITKANTDLGVQAANFTGYPGLRGAKWKEGLLDAATDCAALSSSLGALKAGVIATDRDENVERADQVEDLVDALKEAVEKVAESELVLILEPVKAQPKRPVSLVATIEDAAAVVKAVGSDRVKFAFSIDPAAVLDASLPEQIKKFKDQVGYYRLTDFVPPTGPAEAGYARVLRTIHDVGYDEPIGLGLAPKGDPLAAIEAIRKLDNAAKVAALPRDGRQQVDAIAENQPEPGRAGDHGATGFSSMERTFIL